MCIDAKICNYKFLHIYKKNFINIKTWRKVAQVRNTKQCSLTAICFRAQYDSLITHIQPFSTKHFNLNTIQIQYHHHTNRYTKIQIMEQLLVPQIYLQIKRNTTDLLLCRILRTKILIDYPYPLIYAWTYSTVFGAKNNVRT